MENYSELEKQEVKIKLLFGIMSSFLLLSTSLIPWNTFVAKNIKMIELIQFPFRFFVPVSVLVIYLFLYLIKFNKIIRMLPIVSILQVVILMFVSLNVWNQEEGYIHSGAKAIIANQTSDVIKDSFFTKDKGRALELVAKTTPDYLPTYGETNENKYDLYGEKVIQNNHFFKKEQKG